MYIEVKSKELGIFLVDGYYQIDECGVVNAGRMMTRAYDANNAPGCSVYTTIFKRKFRSWEETLNDNCPSLYNHEWGFTSYTSDDCTMNRNQIQISSPGDEWHCASDCSMEAQDFTNSKVTISGIDYPINKAFLFTQNQWPKEDCWILYGNQSSHKFHISQGKSKVHIALTNKERGDYNGSFVAIELIAYKDGGWKTVKKIDRLWVPGATENSNDNISFYDASVEFDNVLPVNTDFLVKVIVDKWTKYLYCGGIVVETEGGSPIVTVSNGQIQYIDVRGGNVKVYGGHNELLDGKTNRFQFGNLAHQFSYRTFDVRKMVFKAGDRVDDVTLSENDERIGTSSVGGGYMSHFYIIDGEDGDNIKVGTENIKYKDMFPLYGLYKSTRDQSWKGSPFREGDNHIDPYFTDPGYHTATEMEMAHDAQIVTLGAINSGEVQYDGSVTIKLMGIGTNWLNDVGYFYYPKSAESYILRDINGEKVVDFNRVPKIVIRKNMQRALNGQLPTNTGEINGSGQLWFQHFSKYVDGCAVLDMSTQDFESLKNSGKFSRYADNQFDLKSFVDGVVDAGNSATAKEATFEAPIYKLVYYGWEDSANPNLPNGTPSYVWPKDMVIGFFGIRTGDEAACELARIYASSASVQRNYFNDLPRGSAFSYKGKNYIGLEDELDYDNNDFLFEVMGVQSIVPDITPKDDVTTDKTIQNWIVACEDLGGVWDYDFNDLVWAVSKEVNTTTTIHGSTGEKTEVGTTDIYFQALAAGGTLEAIVEYNTSIALSPTAQGWDDNAWIQLGEIHKLVKQDDNAQMTGEGAQLNVKQGVTITQYGKRIKLGSTIPTNSSDINMASILSHFRVRIKGANGEYVVTKVTAKEQSDSGHGNEHHDYISTASNVPQFILLPGGWDWPAEGVCINEAYSGVTNWVTSQNNTTWYNDAWSSHTSSTGARITNPLK